MQVQCWQKHNANRMGQAALRIAIHGVARVFVTAKLAGRPVIVRIGHRMPSWNKLVKYEAATK